MPLILPLDDEALKFSNESKLRAQMSRRGWTEQQIREAFKTAGLPATGKAGPATRFVHPTGGKSVVVDNSSGDIFHVGDVGYAYD